MRRLTCPIALALVLAACGGDPAGPEPTARVQFSLMGADAPLTGTVGERLPVQLEVQAMRVSGTTSEPAPGQVVSFIVPDPECGRPFAGSATTNSAGSAREQWELGTKARTCTMEVRAVNQETGEPLVLGTFTVDVKPGLPTFVGFYSLSETRPAAVFLGDVLPLTWFVGQAHDAYRNPITDFEVAGRVLTGPATIVDGALVGGGSEVVGTVEVSALGVMDTIAYVVARDLRKDAWRLEATCSSGQTIAGTTYTGFSYDLAVDSITYSLSNVTGPVATIQASGTVMATAVASQGGHTTVFPVTWQGTVSRMGHPGEVHMAVRQLTPAGLNLSFTFRQRPENPDYYDAQNVCLGSAVLSVVPAS